VKLREIKMNTALATDEYVGQDFWFMRDSYTKVHKDFLEEINRADDFNWINSSYIHDATGSVMLEINIDIEKFIQIFIFENEEEAKKEGVTGDMYSVFYSNMGIPSFSTNDKEELLSKVLEVTKNV
jgi:hypothetical protein|tara:strand:+ start:142 stop:519 length:378 start_codon:yes stop_codon:yes gene_type:complete